MSEMERRRAATVKTMERFKGKAKQLSKGRSCVCMARAHLKNMGHNPPTVPRFRSTLGAKKALKANGWASVEEMLDSLLPRIAPAQMLLGDVVTVPGEGGLDAVMICAGPFKLMGWREDAEGLVVLDIGMDEISGAWRA